MGKTLEECYEVLGLDYCATEDEIKSAYRQKALKCHPDKNPDDPLSTQKFQELGHAYRRLMGDEDSDDDGDYDDDDDMDLWRDFFFFLFREEIMARVRCNCSKCGSHGDEDDDFLASLAKEQEERQQFTEEEMAQFTSFANLKEQREANKQKFCNKNMSSCKPEQKTNKGHKPKLKSSKQLKHEQWKREKEITEIAAQINQNPNLQEKKAPKKKDLHQDKSSIKPVAVKPEHIVKEQTDPVASNRRNTRKKRNRNKSKKQGNQETEPNQNYQSSSDRNTTFFQQKVASSFVVQDAGKNVTIKPETTRRQDDVTGRLPRHTGYTSPRMTQLCAWNSAFSNHRNTSQNQSERRYQFEYPKQEATSRPAYGPNIWHKRQQKQQLLAELQPTNQTDEELQLQIALELSRKQTEIDAQQREISILEKQMEETLQIENNLQLKTVENEDGRKTATLSAETTCINIDHDSFPPLGVPLRVPLGNKQGSDVDEEWVMPSGSDEEWGDYNNDDDEPEECVTKCRGQEWGNNACDNDDDVAGRCVTKCSEEEWANNTCDDDDEAKDCLAECGDLDEEHLKIETISSIDGSERNNMKLPKPDEQLPEQFREEGSQASDSCPYGKNCCLGKRCKYSHPVSVNKRKRHWSLDDSSGSQDKRDITKSESRDDNNTGHILPGEQGNISIVASYEGLVKSDNPDVSYPASSNGRSHGTSITDFDDSITNNTLQASQPETSVTQLNKSSIQSYSPTGILENANQPLINNIPGLESRYETSKTNSAISDEMKTSISSDAIESGKNETSDPCENSGDLTEESVALVPRVDWVAKSPFPATGDLKQSTTTMPHLADVSAAAKVQNSSQRTSQPVNYVKPLPVTVSSTPPAQSPGHTALIPGTLPGASQNTAILSETNTPQTSENGQKSSSLESSTPAQPVTTNNIPAMPSFSSLPFGNFLPFLNPANVATFNQNANASLLAASSLGGMPLPIIPGLSNSVQNPQGGGTVLNPGMPLLYGTKAASGSAVANPGYYLPIAPLNAFAGSPAVANMSGLGPQPLQPLPAGLAANTQATAQAMLQVNGLSGMQMVASMQAAGPRPLQPSQPGLTNNSQSTSQVIPQLNGSSGTPLGPGAVQPSQSVPASNPQSSTACIQQLPEHGFAGMPNMLDTGPAQLSQAGLTSIPLSTPLNMSQLFRVPFPFNPQALVNLNAQMTAMSMPYLTPQNGYQTTMKSQSGLDSSLVQVNGKSTEMDRVEQVGSKTHKLAEIKRGVGDERESSGVGSKAPSLRRPSTVPKVIQHQASI